MAPAVLTFLTTNDFTGKTVIPFMTNGGWPGHVIKDMKASAKELPLHMKCRFSLILWVKTIWKLRKM